MIQLKGLKFVTALVLVFIKIESKDKTRYGSFYSSSKGEIIINESDIGNQSIFTAISQSINQSVFTTIMKNIRKSSLKDSGWIIDSVINPLAWSSCKKIPKELGHPRKGLIIIQNTDYIEWSKWCLVRYLNPADHNPKRITKSNKDFAKTLDFKDIKSPVKIRNIHTQNNKKKEFYQD